MSLALLSKSNVAIGSVAHSMLTEPQFQAINGISWVLMDGRSIVGSALAILTGVSTISDARGLALRGKNNGRVDGNQDPDGERTIGAYQADAFNSHTHTQDAHNHTQDAHNHAVLSGINQNANSSSFFPPLATSNTFNRNTSSTTATNQAATATNQNTGGNETRMRNIATNIFIKIN